MDCCGPERPASPPYVLVDVDNFGDNNNCALVIGGSHSAIEFCGSRTLWKRKTILEKYRDALCSPIDAQCVTLYANVRGARSKSTSDTFCVVEHGGSVTFDALDKSSLERELQGWIKAGVRCIISLADAVWFKQNSILFKVEDVFLGNGVDVYNTIVLPFISSNIGFPHLQATYDSLIRLIRSRVDDDCALELANVRLMRLYDEIHVDFPGKPVAYEAQGPGWEDWGFPFNIPPTFNRVSSLVHSLEETNIVGRVDNMVRLLEDQQETVLNFVSNFVNLNFSEHVDNAMCDAILFIDFVRGLIEESWYQIISCIMRLGHRLGISKVIISQFVKYVRDFTSPQVRVEDGARYVEAQGPLDIAPIFVAFVGLLLLRNIPDKNVVRSIVDQARSFNVLVPTMRNMTALFQALPTLLPDVVQAWMQYLCPAEIWFKFVNGGFRDWANRADVLLVPTNEAKCQYDEELQIAILKLRDEGKTYIDLAVATPEIPQRLFLLIEKMCKRIQEFVDLVEMAKGTRGHRLAPFVVSMYGDSNIGKSNMISHFANLLRPQDYPVSNLVYCRQAGTPHWDGYTGNFCTSIDDYNQFVQSEDYKEMVAMCTTEVYRVPMASLNDKLVGVKGAVFRSDLVVTTTNVPFPVINDVRIKEAIWRRRHCLWHVRVKECYLGPIVNEVRPVLWDKIPVEVSADFGFYEWRLHHAINSSADAYLTPWISTVDAFALTLREWTAHRVTERMLYNARNGTSFVDRIRAQAAGELDFVDARQEVVAQGLVEDCARIFRPSLARAGLFTDACWSAITLELEKARSLWQVANPTVVATAAGLAMVATCAATFLLTFFSMKPNYEPESATQYKSHVARNGRPSRKNLQRFPEGAFSENIPEIPELKPIQPDQDYFRVVSGSLGQQFIKADPDAGDFVRNTLAASMIFGELKWAEKKFNHMCGFAVGYDFVLMPYHFFLDPAGDLLPDGITFRLIGKQKAWFDVIFERRFLHRFQASDREKDVVLYKCGPRFRPYPDRARHFISHDDLAFISNKPACLLSNKDASLAFHFLPRVREVTENIAYKVGKTDFRITRGWEYYTPSTGVGDCGAILCISDVGMTRKLIGMHVAGTGKFQYGLAEVIFQEEILKIYAQYPVKVQAMPRPSGNVLDEESNFVVPQGDFSIIGKMPPGEVMRLPSKTSLLPSVIQNGVARCVTGPAVLSPTDERLREYCSPLEKGVEKYAVPSSPFKGEALEMIIADMIRMLDWPGAPDLFVLNDMQAINGIPGYEYLDCLNMQSSPGWPYKLHLKGKSKAALFEGEPPEWRIENVELQRRVELRERFARVGIRVPSAWVDCLKDERRSLEKIREGKTRIFAIAPLDFVIVMRKFYLTFAARFYHFRDYGWSAVGMDCESPEWNKMLNYLLEMSNEGFAGDFGRFDGTLSADCMFACQRVIDALFPGNEEEILVRHTLMSELIHTVHLAMDAAYVCHGGNPSGNPLTVIMNSMVNFMYLAYSFLEMAPLELRSMHAFHDNVRVKVYGDDNMVAVHPRVQTWFNLLTVSDFLSMYGISYLDDTKHQAKCGIKPILEMSFLKRSSVRIPEISSSVWLARISVDVVNELTNWIRESDNDYLATVENVQTALRFAFFHGRLFFEGFRRRLALAFQRLGYQVPAMHDWIELRAIYLEKQGFACYEAQGDIGTSIPVATTDPKGEMDVTHSHGIVLSEQTPVVVQTTTRGHMDDSTFRATERMQDVPWTLAAMVERFNYVQTLSWPTSSTDGTVLLRIGVPFGLVSNDVFSSPFKNFTYWRGDIVVRFQLNGTRFHSGRLICYFVPLTQATVVASWHESNRAAQTTVPHVFLDPSVSTTAELRIPFVNYKNFLRLTNGDNTDFLGQINVQVFNVLNAAASVSPAVSLTIFASFPKSVFHVPSILHTVPTSSLEFNDEGAFRGVRSNSWADISAQGNTVSSRVTNVIQRCADVSMPIETVGDKFDVKAKVSGMDKVNCTVQPQYAVRKPMGYMSHCENLEMLQRLTLKPSSLNIVDPEHFGTGEDEMKLKYLLTLPTYLDRFSWTDSNSVGAVLFSWPLMPMGEALNKSTFFSKQIKSFFYPTLWSYTCAPFSFWRGSIRVHLDFVATAFHSGRMYLAVNYGAAAPPTTILNFTDQYGVMIDLNAENHHFTFDIPFLSAYEWLHVYNGSRHDTINNFGRNQDTLGWMSLVVANPLVHPENVSTGILVNIFMAGGDDFEVNTLTTNNMSLIVATAQGAVDSQEMDTMEQRMRAVTVGTRMISEAGSTHFGEKYTSIREIVKRYGPGYMITHAMSFPEEHSDLRQGICSELCALSTGPLMSQGMLAYFGLLYRVWRGSLRVKIMYHWNNPAANKHISAKGVGAPATELLGQFTRCRPKFYTFFTNNLINPSPGDAGELDDTRHRLTSTAYLLPHAINIGAANNLLTPYRWNGDPADNYDTVGDNSTECIQSPPLDIADDDAAYHEVEIPFATQMNILSTPLNCPFRDFSDAGTLHCGVILPARVESDEFDLSYIAKLSPSSMWSVAAGDDFRFGLLLGPHLLTIGGVYKKDLSFIDHWIFDDYEQAAP